MGASRVATNWVTSWRLALVTTIDGGSPRATTNSVRLLQLFPRSVGLGPTDYEQPKGSCNEGHEVTLPKTIKLSVLTAHKMLPLAIDWYFHHLSF
jgi:hypothetical protein